MRKELILVAFLVAGCGELDNNLTPSTPTQIEGLELTFLEPGLPPGFLAIEFTSESTGFITNYNGQIFMTTDSGVNWKETANSNSPISDLYFLNENEGWAVGYNSLVMRTKDAGYTWDVVDLETSNNIELRSVWFVNDEVGFISGNKSIFKTTDGGETWKEIMINNPRGIATNLAFFNENNGILIGTFGLVAKTSDGANTIDLVSNFSADALSITNDLAFAAKENKVYRSADQGNSWSSIYSFDVPVIFYSISFPSDQTGFAFGIGKWIQSAGTKYIEGHSTASIYYTIDGGQSWIGSNAVHEMGKITAASFPSPRVGYAMTNGVVVRIQLK